MSFYLLILLNFMDKEFLKENNLEVLKLSLWKRVLFKIWPQAIFKITTKETKINIDFYKLHKIFSKSEKIDIFLTGSNKRGFILVLNQQVSLFFYQDGDSFKYDGFEIGEYNKGDVTIFDSLSN